jgi:RNA polymerase sigma-70 factor (ECF subfamily)
METRAESQNVGLFDERYLAFIKTAADIRASLHRYCSRMTGSIMDGEDLVQDTLFQAYQKISMFDASRPLKPWLFRIAHNLCIDFLRRRGVREVAETAAQRPDSVPAREPVGKELNVAIEHLVTTLPPKERACVLLKDVFDYSLEEIAEMVDSTVGGVKAALKRGRTKLAASPQAPSPQNSDPEREEILRLYVDRFNRHDWDGVRELISADARLLFANGFAGKLADSPYFAKYEAVDLPWRMILGYVEGEPVIIRLRPVDSVWTPESVIRLEVENNQVVRIVDYLWCPWLLPAASSVVIEPNKE